MNPFNQLLIAGGMLLIRLEPLPGQFPEEVAVLSRVRGQRNAEIHVDGGRTREGPRYGEVAAEILRDKAPNEHKVVVPLPKPRPNGKEGRFRQCGLVGLIVAICLVFHGLQKPSHSRSAAAWSGPRRPVRWRSR